MVAPRQLSLRSDVVPEDPAVVDHARDHPDPMPRGGVEAELAGPGLERIEDDHRPVDRRAEALEAADQVEGESVGRPGSHTDRVGQTVLAQGRHGLPDLLALVAGPVGVVEQQNVEALLPEPVKAALRGGPQILGVLTRAAQRGIGEAREALRPIALALVEVMAPRPDEAVVAPRNALER